MNGLLFLSALLLIPGHDSTGNGTNAASSNRVSDSPPVSKKAPTFNTATPAPSNLQSTATAVTTSTTRTTPTTPSTAPFIFQHYKQECPKLLMVSGILIIICTVFLIIVLMLLYKMCQLSRRLKTLSNSDLINMSEYSMGTAESNKNKPETEAKESTMLMADLSQTQDETNNGTIKKDGEKVKEDEQTTEEKEVGGAAGGEEASAAPVTVAESPSSSKPEEEATDSQSGKAEEAASSEGKEEPDVENK